MKKDKQKVIGEDLADEPIKVVLSHKSYDDTPQDFMILLNAYRQLRPFDFDRLLAYFVDAGHDINAQNTDGETLLKIVQGHAKAGEYVDALLKAGAN